MKFLKQHALDAVALAAITLLITIFFFRFFWPEPQLLVTPDFGRSDAWHFSFATKFALSESLTRGQLPLWEPRMGMGFPLFAEGQVGALFLPNLLLMSLPGLTGLNPVTAYNATYVFLFLTLGWGMYAWLRVIGCSRLASFFGAITITFSGQTIPRLPHHTLLQSLSMTPILMALAHLMIVKKNPFWISLFAVALSQQFFTGSPQPVFLTLFLIGIYTVLMGYRQGLALSLTRFARLSVALILALGIAAVQILPSAEMLSQSTSPQGFSPEEASYYSFPLVHLQTLIDPFILGNPKIGSYPPFTIFDGSIFWENNLYVGWLPFAIIIFGLISFARHSLVASIGSAWKNKSVLIFFLVTLSAAFLLMLGKHSPLYLVYSVWPFNLFRVPSRFAWIFLFVFISAAAWFLTQMNGKMGRWKILFSVIVSIAITMHGLLLLGTWWNYHSFEPVYRWLTASPLIKHLQTAKGLVRTIGVELTHNKQFLKTGWGTKDDIYKFLTNVPSPNGNLYWGLTQTDVYAGRFLKRPSLVESLVGSEIKSTESIATVSAQGKRLLDVFHAAIIVSAVPLDITPLLPVLDATASGSITITANRNDHAQPRVYLAGQTILAASFSKSAEALASPNMVPGMSAIVHDPTLIIPTREWISRENPIGTVTISSDDPMRVSMHAEVLSPQAILIFGDTYYPGWVAKVDGIRTPIYPVNIKERGIVLAAGNHEIIWTYEPVSFYRGMWVTIVSLILTILFPMVFHLSAARLHKDA